MRMSSSLVAPSAVAILSTALLYSLTGAAMSQTTPNPTLPSITVDAPAAMALTMSPEYWMPPSPITGTPAGAHAWAAS